MWNLTCSACHPGPHPQSLSVCLMDAGRGSLMEAAPCGRAAAGRLKLQVERVTGCRRRSSSMRLYCSKKKKKRGWGSMQTLWFESVKFRWGEEIPAGFFTGLLSPNTEWHVIPATYLKAFSNCSRANLSTYCIYYNFFLTWGCGLILIKCDKWLLLGKTSSWCQHVKNIFGICGQRDALCMSAVKTA